MSLGIRFSPEAWEDYEYWQSTDKSVLKKIHALIRDIRRDPISGIGKPEPLKHALSGWWSRRITEEHRIVYRVEGGTLHIVQLKYHYS